MKKMINATHIEGVLYDHSLETRTSGPNSKNPGTEYITGSIDVATDDALTNIVTIHYTYVTAKDNARYSALLNIVNGIYFTVMNSGADKATKLRIDSALDLNEFYSDRTGTEELVSAKRNEGGFIHVVTSLNDNPAARATFDADMVITGVRHVDGDPDKGTVDKAVVKGCIFNFRNEILPMEFSATSDGAIGYFEGLDASSKNPVFTRVKGQQVSETIKRTITEESAFGDAYVREVTNSRKDMVITWAAPDTYVFDDESTILASELKEAMANRELKVADIKARYDQRKNAAATTTKTPVGQTFTPSVQANDFDF